ncbi:hypothetical protein ACFL07_12380, partial [Pseudomonadota bacterium]
VGTFGVHRELGVKGIAPATFDCCQTTDNIFLARQAGAESAEIRLSSEDNHVRHDVDGDLFLETRITATASGRPDVRQINHND